MWYFLIGFVPFVNPLRAFPLPAFWQDATTFILMMAWVLFVPGRNILRTSFAWLPLSGLFAMTALFFLISLQQLRGDVLSPYYALQVLLVLLGGILVHVTAKNVARSNIDLSVVLVPWCSGIVAALLINIACSMLARNELEFALFRMVPSEFQIRDGGMFGQPNQYGVFCVLALSALCYLQNKNKIRSSIHYFVYAIGAMSVALSGSRSALVVWVAISIFEFWLIAKIDPIRRRQWWFRQALFIGCQVLVILILKFNIIGQLDQASTRVFSVESSARYEQWRDAWLLIQAHPVLGVGFGDFASARFFELNGSLLEPESTHTHNLFSQLLVELGVGAILVLICIFMLIKGSWMSRSSKPGAGSESILLFGWVLGIFIYSNFEYPLWYVFFLYTFLFVSGLAVGRRNILDGTYVRKYFWMQKVGAASLLALGLIAAVDYWRIQGSLLQTMQYLRGKPTRDISVDEVMQVRSTTLFVDQIDELWVDISSYDDGAAVIKFPLVQAAFRRTPSVGSAAQYILYSVTMGDVGRADFVMNRLSLGNKRKGELLRAYLDQYAKRDVALSVFLSRFD